jgi:multiple sugar transport system substrate-binding protein
VQPTTDYDDKMRIHAATVAYRRGRLSRRDLLKYLGAAGVALGSVRSFAPRAMASPAAVSLLQDSPVPADVTKFLTDVGGQFRGTTIKVVTEDTPPGTAIRALMEEQFIPVTGINVEWEVVPLDQVLSKVSVDAAQKLGQNDIYYIDQAWVGRFINDAFDPRELLREKPDLAFPNYNIDDFLQPLIDHIASYGGKMIGFPCDVPIFLYMYRTDIYQELGLEPAATLAKYLANAKAINEAKSAQGVYGTVGQMRSGHYSLACDMTAYVWGHGGSVFTADGKCSLNDAEAIAGIDYMRELQTYMPSAVTTYDWGGQATAIQQGQGGQVLTWGENFPGWDDPTESHVSGLMQPAVPPAAAALRPPDQAGFEETPEVGHQGGSAYCLSRYSKQADAAWVFLQWATSADTQTRASILGGGASPMRRSTYDDPRVAAMKQVGAGTTRHFDAMLQTIETRMGTEPHLPRWPAIATDVIAVELGKLTTGGYASTKEGADAIVEKVNEAAT